LLCQPLLAMPPVRAALPELYEPANDRAAAQEWAAIDPATLFYLGGLLVLGSSVGR
jgi:hypothetical protein